MESSGGSADWHSRLLDCVKKGANDKAKALLQNVNNPCGVIDGSRSTLLHHSARYGNAEMVQHLLELGCNANAIDRCGFSPTMLAVRNADAASLDVLLKSDAYVFTEVSTLQLGLQCSMSSLLIPGRRKHQLILEMLFAKVNERYASHKRSIGKLLLRSSDLDRFAVVVFGCAELAELILKSGYDVELREPTRGCTALHCAIIFGRRASAEALISHGANTYATNYSGMSPLRYYTWNFECVDADSSVLRSFLSYNVDLYLPRGSEVAEVGHLLKYGRASTAETVLQIGLDIVVGYVGLGNTEQERNIAKITVLLLEHGVDAQLVLGNGRTLMEHLVQHVNRLSLNIVLEYLAMISTYDQSLLTERTRNTIESEPVLKFAFDSFAQIFKVTKAMNIHGTVTLVQLLTERKDRLVAFARNQELNAIFQSLVDITSDTDTYYLRSLRNRVLYALERAKFEDKVASIIQSLTGLHADAYHAIVYNIISYLDLHDLNNLCRAESIQTAMES